MMNLVPKDIERYAEAHSSPEGTHFRALTRATRAKTKMSGMLVGHLEGNFLKLLVGLIRAKKVLEIGTFTGYSALKMAEALPSEGRLISLDIDPVNTRLARTFWEKSRAGRKITLKIGPAAQTLKSLKGPFDLVFIDADKQNYLAYWNACVPLVRQGGLLVVDNVLWSGGVLAPKDANSRALNTFNKKIRADRRVEVVMLPVRDGITLALKK